jgi:hypothetical protein
MASPRARPNPAAGLPESLDKTGDGGTPTGYTWRRSLGRPAIFQAARGFGIGQIRDQGTCISTFF